MDTALAGFVRVAFDNHIIPQWNFDLIFAGTPTGALYMHIKVEIRKMWCVKPARRTKYGAV